MKPRQVERYAAERGKAGAAEGTRRHSSASYTMDSKIYDEATKVDAEDGNVVLDGPDGVDVSMTPEAAEETSDRLFQAAAEARGQKLMRP